MFQRLLTLLLALFLISPQPATAFWDDVIFDSPSHSAPRTADAEPPAWVEPVETFLKKALDWVFDLIERPLKAIIQYIADLVVRLWSEYVVHEALFPTPPEPEAVILITSNNLKIKDSSVYCHLYQHGASFNRMYRTATNKESIRQSLLSGRYPWRKEESPATTLDAIMQQGGYRTYISPETGDYTPISRFIKEHSGNRLFIYIEVAEESELSGHGGGDEGIISELYDYLNGNYTGYRAADIATSVKNHLLCFAAEASRHENTVVDLDDYFAQYNIPNQY
jgi:hypothetical protein